MNRFFLLLMLVCMSIFFKKVFITEVTLWPSAAVRFYRSTLFLVKLVFYPRTPKGNSLQFGGVSGGGRGGIALFVYVVYNNE